MSFRHALLNREGARGLISLFLSLPVVLALAGLLFFVSPSPDRNLFSGSEPFPDKTTAAERQVLTGLTLTPSTISHQETVTGIVTLREPAPPGGIAVQLATDNPNAISLPAQVFVEAGETSARFALDIKPTRLQASLTASLQGVAESAAITFLPLKRHDWFVGPEGRPTNAGTQGSPWDLATALAGGRAESRIKPGDIVWLLGGRYPGSFVSTVTGDKNAPVIIRGWPGERAIVDKATVNEAKQPALKVKGSWVWFWGFEIMNSDPNRQRHSPYTQIDRPWRGSGADVYAPNVKFINMTFHDNGQGIWDKQDATEIHGCIFFYNGNNKREHALYLGNSHGTKHVTDNVVFAQGGYGILAHSDSTTSNQNGLHFEGNVTFNNGILTHDDQRTGNLQVGGVEGVAAERIVIKHNYIYNPLQNAASKNFGIRLGYRDVNNRDVKLLDNYIVSEVPLLLWWWQQVQLEGNTIFSMDESVNLKLPAGASAANYIWDFNTYISPAPVFTSNSETVNFTRWRQSSGFDRHSRFIQSSRPVGIKVVVRPNRFEAGRGHLIIYNWDLRDQVSVDVSSILKPGMSYEVRDVQNLFASPVAQGVYQGGTIALPLKLTQVTRPIGNVERQPQHTAPEFVVFLVQPKR